MVFCTCTEFHFLIPSESSEKLWQTDRRTTVTNVCIFLQLDEKNYLTEVALNLHFKDWNKCSAYKVPKYTSKEICYKYRVNCFLASHRVALLFFSIIFHNTHSIRGKRPSAMQETTRISPYSKEPTVHAFRILNFVLFFLHFWGMHHTFQWSIRLR